MHHLKRSKEFAEEIEALADGLAKMYMTPLLGRVIEVLENNTTDNPCIMKAAADEPIFTVKAKDPIAGATVKYWCLMADANNCHENEKIADALEVSEEMVKWKKDFDFTERMLHPERDLDERMNYSQPKHDDVGN